MVPKPNPKPSELLTPNVRLMRHDAQLVQIVDASLADATRRAGDHLACHPGCTQCCHGAFAINPLDALRLRTAMIELNAADPEKAAAITERAREYLVEFEESFPGDRETGILGTTSEEEAAFEEFASDAPCPALNPVNGLCDLYDARPMTCRVFGPPVRMSAPATPEPEIVPGSGEESGFAVCELCFINATPEEIAAAELTVPYAEEEQLLNQMHEEMPSSAGDTIVAYCLIPTPTL